MTLEALRPKSVEHEGISSDGWLNSALWIPTHHSWRGKAMTTPNAVPLGIVCHTSDTDPGTAISMAKRRSRPFGEDKDDRLSSWHISIEADGTVVQMVSLETCAWHAGSASARKLPFGWANYCTVGIELVSPDDKNFPEAQINAAKWVWRAIVREYGIPREHAMIAHGSFEDPNRRVDPGPEWMGNKNLSVGPKGHAQAVLDYAYGDTP